MNSETYLNIRLSWDLKRKVNRLADVYNLPKSEIVRQSLELYVKTMKKPGVIV